MKKMESNFDSGKYWENRYQTIKNRPSGNGSYGKLAKFKADVINPYIKGKDVVELGSGDGNQFTLFKGYKSYVGFDVSQTIIDACNKKFCKQGKEVYFYHMDEYLDDIYKISKVDVVMSLDVLYHLIEDSVYEGYISDLFKFEPQTVIIYAMDIEDDGNFASHVKPRKFTEYIKSNFPNYKMSLKVNQKHPSTDHTKGSRADFFIYELS